MRKRPWVICCRGCCLARLPPSRSAWPQARLRRRRLSAPPDHADRAVCRRRADRRRCAHRRRPHVQTLGQPIMIENVVGAGGTTASTRATRATPDGYTIIMGHMGTHAASVALYPNLAYKPDADFEPIGLVAGTPVLIVAKKDFPPKDLKEFVAYVKANVDKLNMAHAGVGSVSFTTCLLLNSILGVKPTSVPFNGTGPALNGSDRRAGRLHVRPDRQSSCRRCRAARSRPMPSARLSAIRRCRTCRPPRKRACRNSRPRPGTHCSRRKTRRSPSSTSSPARSTRRSTTNRRASDCSNSAASCRTRRDAASRRLPPWSRARSRAGRRSSRRPAPRTDACIHKLVLHISPTAGRAVDSACRVRRFAA